MKSGENLIGGVVAGRKRRSSKAVAKLEPVPEVGLGFLGIVVAVGAIFAVLGISRVHAVFAARDFEIETRRVQELTQERRDRAKLLGARLSSLQRVDVLRGAAADSLGLTELSPQSMRTIAVDAETQRRWERSERRAREFAGLGTAGAGEEVARD